jgi:hypothetical protein
MDELPYALGVLLLSPDEFGKLTPKEYEAKKEGNEKNQLFNVWLMAVMFGRAMNSSKENPYPSLEEFMNPQPRLSDEELFELAKEKGIEIPEGVI